MTVLYIFLWFLIGFASYGVLLYRELQIDGTLEVTIDDTGKGVVAGLLGPFLLAIVVCVFIADAFKRHGETVIYRREK